ncbi:hypothetical protein MSR1_04210 [Magnetospirillum gryphiswaldense MSR-1]|nr:hypothetical protein MSR1_04210 [Magnetospirillum gryphiswaldense MSR-1]AVM76836.1 hypothetical protein MSR1L_04210 [Magnetospirillum gryphiswaldense]
MVSLSSFIDTFLLGIRNTSDDQGLAAIRGAVEDHHRFVARVMGVLDGTTDQHIRAADLSTADSCRLGKWQGCVSDPVLRGRATFKAIVAPHRQVHDLGRQALELWEAGDKTGAREAASGMKDASKQVFAMLADLEREAQGA